MHQPWKSVPFNIHDLTILSLCPLSKSFILCLYRCQKYHREWASNSASGNNLFTSTCARHPTRQPCPLPAIYPLTNVCQKKNEINILLSPYQQPLPRVSFTIFGWTLINVWSLLKILCSSYYVQSRLDIQIGLCNSYSLTIKSNVENCFYNRLSFKLEWNVQVSFCNSLYFKFKFNVQVVSCATAIPHFSSLPALMDWECQ